MIGRLTESDGDTWAGWPLSATASGVAAGTQTPAATAPNTDVFTKSRRGNATDSSPSVSSSICTRIPLRDERSGRRKPEGYHGPFTGCARAAGPSDGRAGREIRLRVSAQKRKTTPPPTKILCCRLLFVVTFRFGIPDQKSLASPRSLKCPISFTSSPTPACKTPVVFPFLFGLGAPDSSVELGPKWPNPPPKLIQGETA